MQRREGISGDFRPGCGNLSEQSRFSSIRVTDQSGVGDRAQLQQEMPLLPFFAFGVFARRAITRALEMNVTFAAGAALRPVTDWMQYNHSYTSAILNDPQVDPIAYERSSPIEFAAGLQDALLICHGVIDDNVLFEDSMRLYERLIELHKDNFSMSPYPLDRHGFTNADSWLDEYKRIYRLFEANLK